MAEHRVASAEEIPEGEGKVVDVPGRQLAVFRQQGQYYALDNACPHRGGPLGDGALQGTQVICPWHGWQFDCTTGRSTVNPMVGVNCHTARVEGDDVLVQIADS
jgi:NAD(P)H-dependent nitrite reductase small subunit